MQRGRVKVHLLGRQQMLAEVDVTDEGRVTE